MGAPSTKQMAFGAKTAAIVASLLMAAEAFVALSGNPEPSSAASTQAAATSMNAWAHPLPGIVNGWNTSVGTERQRDAAAKHFGVSIQTGESVWRKNVMTPFVGKSMLMTGIKIEKRNAFNTLIEHEVKTGKVIWTLKEGTDSVSGPWDEHINGKFTGTSRIAGWVSENGWIESDFKSLFKLKIENDWG